MIGVIALGTIREGFAKKTILVLAGLSAFFLLIALLLAIFVSPDSLVPTPQGGPPLTSAQKLAMQKELLQAVQLSFVGGFTFTALIISVFATAGIFPSAIDKGQVDLLLSKPLSRLQLILGKLLGATMVVGANAVGFITLLWLIMGFALGDFNPTFLLTTLPLVISFLSLFPAMMMLGMLSRGSALPIILTYVWLFLIDPVLQNRDAIAQLAKSDLLEGILDTLYYLLPKISGISALSSAIIMGLPIDWMPLWSSLIFGTVMFAWTFWVFKRRDL